MCIMFSNVICLYASKWGDTWALLLFDTTTSRCYQTRLSHTLHFKAIIPKISHSEEEPLTWMSCPFFNLQPRCQIDWQRLKNKVLWLKCHSTPKERSVRHKINVTSYSIYIIFWAAPFFKTVGGGRGRGRSTSPGSWWEEFKCLRLSENLFLYKVLHLHFLTSLRFLPLPLDVLLPVKSTFIVTHYAGKPGWKCKQTQGCEKSGLFYVSDEQNDCHLD